MSGLWESFNQTSQQWLNKRAILSIQFSSCSYWQHIHHFRLFFCKLLFVYILIFSFQITKLLVFAIVIVLVLVRLMYPRLRPLMLTVPGWRSAGFRDDLFWLGNVQNGFKLDRCLVAVQKVTFTSHESPECVWESVTRDKELTVDLLALGESSGLGVDR